MNIYIFNLAVIFFFTLALCIFFSQKKLLLNFTGNNHQKFTSSLQVPLIGGLIFFFVAIFFVPYFNVVSKFAFLLILLVGLFSDLKFINKPKVRFLFQLIIIFFFLIIENIHLINTKIFLLDFLLQNYFFSILFTSFCFLIIINGSNFLDGINLLAIGYYLSITIIIYILRGKNLIFLDNISTINIVIVLLVLLFFNLFDRLYLGDSGSYLLGFIFSLILVNSYLQNTSISPFFIILLLWYPGFENLFTIIRRYFKKKSPAKPDTEHLHQLVYEYFKKKSLFRKKILKKNFPSFIIIFYNFIIMFLSTFFIFNSKILLLIIFFNIFLYCYLYNFLIKK
jgi:UDP-N-acetylmuramyl pentapeptide phosphotransferase/UDP-N-acetylglucosamine-1-phosphate transferase